SRIAALLRIAAARVVERATGLLDLAVVLVPVGGPLPDVPGHLVESIAVRRERADRCRPLVTIFQQVLPWEFALPGVGHVATARREFGAPCILHPVETATRSEFPFGLGRQ